MRTQTVRRGIVPPGSRQWPWWARRTAGIAGLVGLLPLVAVCLMWRVLLAALYVAAYVIAYSVAWVLDLLIAAGRRARAAVRPRRAVSR